MILGIIITTRPVRSIYMELPLNSPGQPKTHVASRPGHVQFISLMSGVPWGGSEDLWRAAAERLLGESVRVSIVAKKWDAIPDKMRSLIARGAGLVRYREGFEDRVRSGLIRRGIRARAPFRLLKDADISVVSLGSFADARWYLPITDELLNDGHRFIAVFHNAPPLPEELSDVDREFLRRFYSSAERVFFVAEKNREVAEEMLGAVLPSAELINNPVNLSHTGPRPFPDQSVLRLVCVGRLDFSAKGQDVLVRALARNWKSRDFELLFFGAGDDEARLNELIRENELEGKVGIAGFTDSVDEIYRDAHALVLPSRYEGMPIVCVEAALSGRPAMITDVGDSKRCFLEGVSGFVAEECSEEAVADAMERLWNSRDRLAEMGGAAHADVMRNFSEDGVGKLLRAIGV
jgi:glycosyltransferase involved in cell wall biosynthesis